MEICYEPFKNLNVEFKDSEIQISPCCISPAVKVKNIDFYNNKYLEQIRESWKTGQFPNACESCLIAEKNNLASRRQGSTKWFKDHNEDNIDVKLTRIDFWVGDLCNLKCVICGPQFSTSWKQELNISAIPQKTIVNRLWKDIDLSHLKYVHFNGGEPLLSKNHVDFLIAIPNKQNVEINYNTNATIKPSKQLLELWKEFKLVLIDFSIDDIEKRFEYQRFPAKWDEVVDNLNYFKTACPVNCMFNINTSLGILNNSNYPILIEWLKNNFASNRVNDPVEFRTQLVTGILSLSNFLNKKKEVLNYLNVIDSNRGTNWRFTFPELEKIL
jgi:sulfatase maturation enzyme AslB (radical SAM superfamily)